MLFSSVITAALSTVFVKSASGSTFQSPALPATQLRPNPKDPLTAFFCSSPESILHVQPFVSRVPYLFGFCHFGPSSSVATKVHIVALSALASVEHVVGQRYTISRALRIFEDGSFAAGLRM